MIHLCVCCLWYPSVFLGGKSTSVLSKDLVNSEPPLDNPVHFHHISISIQKSSIFSIVVPSSPLNS